MAYYNSSSPGYGYGYGEYNLNYNQFNYDSVPAQSFMGYSGYEYNPQPLLTYYPNPCYASTSYEYDHYNSSSNNYCSNIAYSVNTVSEPKLFEYHPSQTQLVISYSTLEFNESDFEEYDPTPYDGGYDITETYGKPLPPSDETCYPRSTPDANAYGSMPVAEVEDESIKLEPTKKDGAAEQENQLVEVTDNSRELPLPEFEESRDNKKENGYETEKIVSPQYPSGYGLETLDLCESLFGHWPCLSRMKNRIDSGDECDRENVGVQEYKDEMYRGTADYIFGNPNPYGGIDMGGRNYGGDVLYAYQTHYPAQSFWAVQYDDDVKLKHCN